MFGWFVEFVHTALVDSVSSCNIIGRSETELTSVASGQKHNVIIPFRFESKHKFFRSEFCNKKCLKNPTKTISNAHQHMQSSLYIDTLFARHPILKEAVSLSGLNVEDEIMQCLNSSFGPLVASKLLYSSEVTYHNTLYQKGAIVVVSTQKYPQIECLKLHLLLSDGKIAYAIGV